MEQQANVSYAAVGRAAGMFPIYSTGPCYQLTILVDRFDHPALGYVHDAKAGLPHIPKANKLL